MAEGEEFRDRVAFTKPADETLLMVLGVAACFSAEPDGAPRICASHRASVAAV
jgi:hypothetical protein